MQRAHYDATGQVLRSAAELFAQAFREASAPTDTTPSNTTRPAPASAATITKPTTWVAAAASTTPILPGIVPSLNGSIFAPRAGSAEVTSMQPAGGGSGGGIGSEGLPIPPITAAASTARSTQGAIVAALKGNGLSHTDGFEVSWYCLHW